MIIARIRLSPPDFVCVCLPFPWQGALLLDVHPSPFISAAGAPQVPVALRAARSLNIRRVLVERLDNLATTT